MWVGRALQTDGGRGQEGSWGGGIKEDQTGKDKKQTPAAQESQVKWLHRSHR